MLFSHIPDHARCDHHRTDDQNHQSDILSTEIHPVMEIYSWHNSSAVISNADQRVCKKHPYTTKSNCNADFHQTAAPDISEYDKNSPGKYWKNGQNPQVLRNNDTCHAFHIKQAAEKYHQIA